MREPLNGHFEGHVFFTKESFGVIDSEFDLGPIKEIRLSFNDFQDQLVRHPLTPFRQKESQGVDNSIHVLFNDGNDQKIYVQRDNEGKEKLLKPFLKSMIFNNKMDFMHAIEILELSEYREIEESRNQLLTK